MTKAECEARRARWRELVDRCAAGGQSKAAFCRENDLSIWQFHYWARRFRESNGGSGFSRIEVAPASGVRLRLPNGLSLELTDDFDETILARFLSVASRVC